MRGRSIGKSFSATAPSAASRPASSPPLPPPSSSSPTSEYRHHHQVTPPAIDGWEFRPHWLVRTRLSALFESGRIDLLQLQAGVEWRGWHEALGRQPIQTWETPVDAGRRPGLVVGDQQINAVAQLRGAAAAIGLARTRLLEMGIRDEWPWGQIARRIGMSDKTATGRVVEAIAALTLWRPGEPVPAAPKIKFRNQPGSW
jgi:hypothetical protein